MNKLFNTFPLEFAVPEITLKLINFYPIMPSV